MLLLALVYISIEANQQGDFSIFWQASRDYFDGKNIYTLTYHEWYHYYYSQLFAILLFPLAMLPLYAATWIWLALNLFFLWRIFAITLRQLQVEKWNSRSRFIFLSLIFIFNLRFIRDNFHLGQMTVFMAYCMLESLSLIYYQRHVKGAALLALGINIKLLPLVFIPYLIFRGYFLAACYTCVAVLAYFLIPLTAVEYHQYVLLMHDWWQLINPTQTKHTIDTDERSFHGLSTLIPTLCMETVPDTHALPLRRNMFNLSSEKVFWVLNLIRLALVLSTIAVTRLKFFKPENNKLKRWKEAAYIMLIIPLIFPHQQHYAFLLSMPAFSYILYLIMIEGIKKYRWQFCLLIMVYLCFNLNLLVGSFGMYYDHYKIVTYGALLLVVILLFTKQPLGNAIKSHRLVE
ncbi:MAG: DUF2029 domain-containing protein [Crocinitomicaceae bacterium]|nr:DUF2029 domain-containing protein [Crocinitomicaceae bacterium]